jgi:hypothetical protein
MTPPRRTTSLQGRRVPWMRMTTRARDPLDRGSIRISPTRAALAPNTRRVGSLDLKSSGRKALPRSRTRCWNGQWPGETVTCSSESERTRCNDSPDSSYACSHVNNVRYAEWFESARIKYWDSLEHEFPASEGNMVSEPATRTISFVQQLTSALERQRYRIDLERPADQV